MRINRVTFTGADDNTKYEDLLKIQEEFPMVEWGILFSGSRKGTEKYPTQEWIDNLPIELHLSAHFCGKYSREVIENHKFIEIESLPANFYRIQLNYTFSELSGVNYDFYHLFNKFKEYSADCILQYNKSNSRILNKLLENKEISPMFSFLYDSSGGRGVEIKEIKAPFNSHTGYSGGLNPDNIERIVSIIENYENESNVWIDMEAGVRTDGKFDLNKVRKVLEIVTKKQVSI